MKLNIITESKEQNGCNRLNEMLVTSLGSSIYIQFDFS